LWEDSLLGIDSDDGMLKMDNPLEGDGGDIAFCYSVRWAD
jgi:hypothetical protein